MMPNEEDVLDEQAEEEAEEEADEDSGAPESLTDAALSYTFSECEIHGVYLGDACPLCGH